jgi:hypothetical protein
MMGTKPTRLVSVFVGPTAGGRGSPGAPSRTGWSAPSGGSGWSWQWSSPTSRSSRCWRSPLGFECPLVEEAELFPVISLFRWQFVTLLLGFRNHPPPGLLRAFALWLWPRATGASPGTTALRGQRALAPRERCASVPKISLTVPWPLASRRLPTSVCGPPLRAHQDPRALRRRRRGPYSRRPSSLRCSSLSQRVLDIRMRWKRGRLLAPDMRATFRVRASKASV